QGFAIHDAEVASMSRAYALPDARYFVVERGGEVVGGGGFGRLHGSRAGDATCELRKMYFRPAARRLGAGRALLGLPLAEMRACSRGGAPAAPGAAPSRPRRGWPARAASTSPQASSSSRAPKALRATTAATASSRALCDWSGEGTPARAARHIAMGCSVASRR